MGVSWDSVTGADRYTVTLVEAMGDNQQGPCHQSSNKPISVDTTNTSVSIDKTKLRAYTTYSITVTAESDLSNSSHKSIPFIFTTQQNGKKNMQPPLHKLLQSVLECLERYSLPTRFISGPSQCESIVCQFNSHHCPVGRPDSLHPGQRPCCQVQSPVHCREE